MTNEAAAYDAVSVVDTRGMRCPWPALRLARAMRSETAVTLIADDPQAAREIAALVQLHGWQLDAMAGIGNAERWRIRRG